MTDYQRKKMTEDEKRAIMCLDMTGSTLESAVNRLARRLDDYKYTKRDLGMARSAVKRLMEAATDGTDAEQLAHVLLQSRDFILDVVRISPVRKTAEIVMPMEDEWQFIQIAIDARCSTCLKTAGEAKACPLRKMLRKYTSEPETTVYESCGYQGGELRQNKLMNKQEKL